MVRVISVHHFANQQVLTVEQPTASTVAPPNRLLLALSSHSIEVRDLHLDGEVLFTFPTVDEVAQIYHCVNGDYVATLETKFNRQNRELNFARVYINWSSVATLQQSKMNHSGASLSGTECGMVQPMRARIAGRVTPTTNQSELASLEMIEIPVTRNPHLIAVCQVSGNILVAAEKALTVYAFALKTHDISKLQFVDFEELPLRVEVAFKPTQVAIAENYVACASADAMHLMRVTSARASVSDLARPDEPSDGRHFSEDAPIDYQQLLTAHTIRLPTIARENSAVHRHSPFAHTDRDLSAELIAADASLADCRVEHLIQLKLRPIVVDGAHPTKTINEAFKAMALKPLYVDEAVSRARAKSASASAPSRVFGSAYGAHLHSVACLVATQQEGFMYQFVDAGGDRPVDNCVTVYPFTAPVFKVVLEDYFLHALTEVGLESYTMRLAHGLCESLQNDNTCPPVSESVCLVGLRPFIGIEQLLLSNDHLVLLASAETSSPTHSCSSSSGGSSTTCTWTLYALELPSPKAIFDDIAIVADAHRLTSPATYGHLMSEAHMILRAALLLRRWAAEEGGARRARPARNDAPRLLAARGAYQQSCALLADHHVMAADERQHALAPTYYRHAGLCVRDVVERVRRLREQTHGASMRGTIHYLKAALIGGEQQATLFGADGRGNRARLSESVLQLFEQHDYDELPTLILKVPLLREYGTDKLIGLLSERDAPLGAERRLALVVLCTLKGDASEATRHLAKIDASELSALLVQHWELLFEQLGVKGNTSFSELATLLATQRTTLIAGTFATLVERKTISLGRLLKIFLDHMPSSSDASHYGQVLQTHLEHHFRYYFAKHDAGQVVYDRSTHEAMKLLVRSYLSQLQYLSHHASRDERQEATPSPKDDLHLFAHRRHEYLNRMPPFCANVAPDGERRHKSARNERADRLLKKLQALLCSRTVPNQVLVEVGTFLGLNEHLRGRLSLQICITSVNAAISLLADECPQCLLQYAKDVFGKADEWKMLIAAVQHKVLSVSHAGGENRACVYYKRLLRDVLTHVATTMNLETLINVFPQHMDYSTSYVFLEADRGNLPATPNGDQASGENEDILNEIQNYEPYITLCKETMHANQIKKLITATGQQLLCTLNL